MEAVPLPSGTCETMSNAQLHQMCAHHRVATVNLGGDAPARAAFHHCALSERLFRLADDQHGSAPIAVCMAAGPGNVRLAITGPDMGAVTPAVCTPDRCHLTCRDGYKMLVRQMRLEDPQLDSVLCGDEGAVAAA